LSGARWRKENGVRKTFIIGILACALLFLAAAYAWKAPQSNQAAAGQKPWNSRAIGSAFTGVQVREVDATHAAVDFLYDLDNRTNSDFRLAPGPSNVIMRRLKADGSLSSDKDAHLAAAAFVPTNNRTRVAVEVTDAFDWPAKEDAAANQAFRSLVAREASGLEGFVIFDQISRYEIELPIDLATSLPAEKALQK
jgi:hypothetical protein